MRGQETGYLVLWMLLLFSSCATRSGTTGVQAALRDTLGDKVLQYQLPNGGWSKHLHDHTVVDYSVPLTNALLKKIEDTDDSYATLDNKATTREIYLLRDAYERTENERYLDGLRSGIAYLLAAQYENGGFPQYYPSTSLYRAQITFNDDAMINALRVLSAVATGDDGFDFLDDSCASSAKAAVQKGIDCILSLQVRQADTLAIWAAQYDEKTLLPAQARSYEPVSLSTSESVGIVRFLMDQPPTPAIEKAVHAAIKWFEEHDIEGYRFDTERDSITGEMTRNLVKDDSVNSWARFYDIQNNRPMFGDRDSTVTYDFREVSAERRHGYAWFGTWPEKLIQREYPKWIKRLEEWRNDMDTK